MRRENFLKAVVYHYIPFGRCCLHIHPRHIRVFAGVEETEAPMTAGRLPSALCLGLCLSFVGIVKSACVRNHTAQISSSIYLAGNWDYMDWYNNGSSNCLTMVDKIARNNVSQIQFLPTFYWYDDGPADPPPGFDPSCAGSDLSGYYCYNRFNSTTVSHWCYDRQGHYCPEVSQEAIDQLITNLGECMKHAVDLGMDIAINTRIDDGRALGGWRNTLDFDPLEVYGNWSYVDAILMPLVEAVKRAVKPTTRGEMGATVFMHPYEWITAKAMVLDRAAQGPNAMDPSQMFVGMAMNNNKLCGCIGVGIVDFVEYARVFPSEFKAVESIFDTEGIYDVFMDYDFIGISAYVPMISPNFTVCDFEGLMIRMDWEMRFYNVTLQDLLDAGKEIHFIEFGVGGGVNQEGTEPARTAAEAAYYPYFGIFGAYTCDQDPFEMCTLDKPSAVRDYRRFYYDQISKYLLQGGCQYKVSTVYLWNLQSWDPQDIYPLPFGNEASEVANPTAYYDPIIVQTINRHNIEASLLGSTCVAAASELNH